MEVKRFAYAMKAGRTIQVTFPPVVLTLTNATLNMAHPAAVALMQYAQTARAFFRVNVHQVSLEIRPFSALTLTNAP